MTDMRDPTTATAGREGDWAGGTLDKNRLLVGGVFIGFAWLGPNIVGLLSYLIDTPDRRAGLLSVGLAALVFTFGEAAWKSWKMDREWSSRVAGTAIGASLSLAAWLVFLFSLV